MKMQYGKRKNKKYGWKLYYAMKDSENWRPLTKGWYTNRIDAVKAKKYYKGTYAKKYPNSWVDIYKLKVKRIKI